MWAQHCVRPIASSGSRAIKKKKIPKKQKTNNKKKTKAFCESMLEVITRFTARGCSSGAERLSAHQASSCSAPSLPRSIRVKAASRLP